MPNPKDFKDAEILGLYESRDESAIAETAKQYGPYCLSIAANILHCREDAEEVVNDAFLKAWNAIPPDKPRKFSSYLGRIVRNLALDRYEARTAKKRGGRPDCGSATLMLSELEACIPAATNVAEEVELGDLARVIDEFLQGLKQDDRYCFVRRYWHGESVPQIAKKQSVGESKVKVSLHRTRKKLKTYLEERGVML